MRAAFAAGLFGLFMLGGQAVAVHDLGLFELDRNAQDPGGAPLPDDWTTLYAGGANTGGNSEAFTGILPDIGADGGTQFQGGGSKDDLDITQWLWKMGEPLDKDDITNAYAAAYVNATDTGDNNIGDLILYYGLDRFSANGSAQVGFWFLQDPNFGLTNTPSGGGFKFSGAHVDNDVLVQSNFSQGGVIDRLSVYKWQSGALVPVILAGADCMDLPAAGADDAACATVNRSPQTAPWPYTPKANEGSPGTFLTGAFFEGGINISRLIPDAGCFTGFLAETRTSTPFDARLKDFVTGSFDLCKVSVEKAGDTLGKVGDDADYTITITNDGSITIYKDDITDTLLGDITLGGVDQVNPLVTSNTCGASLAPGASCTITATRTVQAGDPDPLPNTVSVTYRGKADLSGSAVSDTDDHSVNLFQPRIAIDKTGDTLSKVGDEVNYTITLSNNSSPDTPALTCTATDTLLGSLFGPDTLPLGDTVINTSRVVLEGDPDPLPNTASLDCEVAQPFGNKLHAEDSHSVDLVHPAMTVGKDCSPTTALPGDTITYTCTINNTGDVALVKVSITDSLVGDLTDGTNPAITANTCGGAGATLAAGASCSITYTFTAPSGTATLVNTVTAVYQVEGLPNRLEAAGTCTVTIPSEGCTPGFWKTHPQVWDGLGSDDVTTTIQTTDLFNATFGVTMAESGLANSVTLLDALSVATPDLPAGSDANLAALDRHAAAGLASADSGINYPFTVAEVIALYRDAVGADPGPETISSALAKLKGANELFCPLS